MNNIFSIFECCYQPKIKIEESMIKHTSTKKISNIPNLNKIFENKNLHNHESKNRRSQRAPYGYPAPYDDYDLYLLRHVFACDAFTWWRLPSRTAGF